MASSTTSSISLVPSLRVKLANKSGSDVINNSTPRREIRYIVKEKSATRHKSRRSTPFRGRHHSGDSGLEASPQTQDEVPKMLRQLVNLVEKNGR